MEAKDAVRIRETSGGLVLEKVLSQTRMNSKKTPDQGAGSPCWKISSWLTTLHLLDVLADEILDSADHTGCDDPSDSSMIRTVSPADIERSVDRAVPALKRRLVDAHTKLLQQQEIDAGKLNSKLMSKFQEDGSGFTFKYGTMESYHGGLEKMIGNPDPDIGKAMKFEHCESVYATESFFNLAVYKDGSATCAKQEWEYVVDEAAKEDGGREEGRNGWTLQDFMDWHGKGCVTVNDGSTRRVAKLVEDFSGELLAGTTYTVQLKDSTASQRFDGSQLQWNDIVFRAKLQIWEVIAVRLYTGPMFEWYNKVLRFHGTPFDESRLPFDSYKHRALAREGSTIYQAGSFPFRTTLHVLNSAILKISRLQPAEKVYRGTRGGILPAQFWTPNASHVRGGIELAFMSTTLDRDVARTFAGGGGGQTGGGVVPPSVLFEIQMGMVDRGAAVQWCSQFPAEEEILFAPLTGLEVVGEPTMDGSTIVVRLRLNCNLHDMVIEEVTAKMLKSHLGMVDIIEGELQQLRFPHESLRKINDHRDWARLKDGQWFNDASNFSDATDRALQTKSDACHIVLSAERIGAATLEQVGLAFAASASDDARIAACEAVAGMEQAAGAIHAPALARLHKSSTAAAVRRAAWTALAAVGEGGRAIADDMHQVCPLLQKVGVEFLAGKDEPDNSYVSDLIPPLAEDAPRLSQQACSELLDQIVPHDIMAPFVHVLCAMLKEAGGYHVLKGPMSRLALTRGPLQGFGPYLVRICVKAAISICKAEAPVILPIFMRTENGTINGMTLATLEGADLTSATLEGADLLTPEMLNGLYWSNMILNKNLTQPKDGLWPHMPVAQRFLYTHGSSVTSKHEMLALCRTLPCVQDITARQPPASLIFGSTTDWEKSLADYEGNGTDTNTDTAQNQEHVRLCAEVIANLMQHDKLLGDASTTPAVRVAAARALSRMGQVGHAHVGAVKKLVADETSSVREAVCEALGGMGAAGSAHASEVAAALVKDRDRDVRAAACKALGGMGAAGSAHASEVAALLKDDHDYVRYAACEALGGMGAAGSAHASEVAALLKDTLWYVREAACEVLAGMGAAGSAHASEVAALLKDETGDVREAACKALGGMGAAGSAHASEVAALLKDKAGSVREAACEVLAGMGAAGSAHASEVAVCMRELAEGR